MIQDDFAILVITLTRINRGGGFVFGQLVKRGMQHGRKKGILRHRLSNEHRTQFLATMLQIRIVKS